MRLAAISRRLRARTVGPESGLLAQPVPAAILAAMRAPAHIDTSRLHLRPVQAEDAASIFWTYAGQDAPTRFMNFVRHEEQADSEAFAEACSRSWMLGSAFPWAVCHKDSLELMGVIELRIRLPKADFGYIFGEAFWGRGFATEAAKAVVGWAMDQPSIFRIWATCHPANLTSARVLGKAGLAFEATLQNWEARPQLEQAAGPSDVYAWLRAS